MQFYTRICVFVQGIHCIHCTYIIVFLTIESITNLSCIYKILTCTIGGGLGDDGGDGGIIGTTRSKNGRAIIQHQSETILPELLRALSWSTDESDER